MKTLMAEHFGHHVLTSDSLNYYNYYYKTPFKKLPCFFPSCSCHQEVQVSMLIWKWKGSLVDENKNLIHFIPV